MKCYLLMALMLLVGCTQPIRPTPTLAPTVSAISPTPAPNTDIPPTGESPTATLTSSPSSTLTNTPTAIPSETATATDTPTVTSSPTITLTPFPTWTPWQVDMNFSPTERVVLDPKNPHQNCFLSYFDLTLEPGHLGVWRRDNGEYLICEAMITIRSQP